MSSALVIIITGVLVASACASLGSFLVLRKMAMMSDAISHAILPGLVVGYFLAQGPNFVVGFLGALVASFITVSAVELLKKTKRVTEDAAIGIVFPFMFALGTFAVSKYFSNLHIDTDAILYGNLEFAPFDILLIGDLNLGSQSLWIMGTVLLINIAFIYFFYKELKISTYDPALANVLGFSATIVYYLLMFVVALNTVAAFTAVGSILTVALMIVPAATAYLLTDRLSKMIILSMLLGALSALAGYVVAVWIDASIAGMIATMTGIFFLLAFLFSPKQGFISSIRRRAKQRVEFALNSLLVHLQKHEAMQDIPMESSIENLYQHFRWENPFIDSIVAVAQKQGFLHRKGSDLRLTEQGRTFALGVLQHDMM